MMMKKRAGRKIKTAIISLVILGVMLFLFIRLFIIHVDPYGEGYQFNEQLQICVKRGGIGGGGPFDTLKECEKMHAIAPPRNRDYQESVIERCMQERDHYWKQQCFFDFALAKRDSTLCEKIRDDSIANRSYDDMRKECYEEVTNITHGGVP